MKNKKTVITMKIKNWKYGLIKVLVENEKTELEEQINRLVELYQDENGDYTIFCDADLRSYEELQMAINDIGQDGINDYFYNTGTFEWEGCDSCYSTKLDWTPDFNKEANNIDNSIELENGKLSLRLTPDILAQMGWTKDVRLEVDCNSEGVISISKEKNTKNKNQIDEEDLYSIYGGD